MANLSQLTIPVKNSSTGVVTPQTFDIAGGAGGHTIENSQGVSLPQRTNLKFVNAAVTDDSTNDATIVTPSTDPTNFSGTIQEWEALTQAEKNQYDTVDLTDDYTDLTDDFEALEAVAKLKTWMGTCSSAADAQNKVATVDNEFVLAKGVRVGIKYANSNTFSATTSNPITLNVNGSGAYNIYYASSANPTGSNTIPFGYANRYVYYVFDGNYWVFDGTSTDGYYSAITSSDIAAGTSTTNKLVRADYLKTGIETVIDNHAAEAVNVVANTGVGVTSRMSYKFGKVLMLSFWIAVPTALQKTSSLLLTIQNCNLPAQQVNTYRCQGDIPGTTTAAFLMLWNDGSNIKVQVDNNYALNSAAASAGVRADLVIPLA